MKQCDCLVIGGGASGMMAAITVKRGNPSLRVVLLEGGARVGKKLLTTGNGRCNLTNANVSVSRYQSGDIDRVGAVLQQFDNTQTADFFASLGVPLRQEGAEGKCYPYSLQAASVVDVLRFECDRLGVETVTEAKVTRLLDDGVATADDTYRSPIVVVACGGKTAPHTGSDGSGYALLESVGHRVTARFPAIVPIKTELDPIRAVKGLKIDATVTATADGETRRETGEVLFTEYGLSGPPILQLSSLVARHGQAKLTLDLLPEQTESWVLSYLYRRRPCVFGDTAENLFLGLFHKRIGLAVLKRSGLTPTVTASSLRDEDLSRLAHTVKAFPLTATGVCGFDAAQVTMGGVPLNEFDETLQSKKRAGLFACGEVLDVTGDCGGFNLQWAWASGYVVGRAIVDQVGTSR